MTDPSSEIYGLFYGKGAPPPVVEAKLHDIWERNQQPGGIFVPEVTFSFLFLLCFQTVFGICKVCHEFNSE